LVNNVFETCRLTEDLSWRTFDVNWRRIAILQLLDGRLSKC
jgi:hypothetical protein